MSEPPMPTHLVNVLDCDGVAALLKVTPSTIKGLVRTGQLQAVRIGRHQRFDARDVREFVDRQREDRRC